MSYTKTSLLLLLALFAISVYAKDDNDPWKCHHDTQEKELPEALSDVLEDYNPNGNNHTGRLLQSYPNLRTYGYYGALSSASAAFRTYVQNQLVPPILDYFSGALRVKYPVSGPLKINVNSLCNIPTPAILRAGVDADYIYLVSVDYSSSYVAQSSACNLAPQTNRPLVGHTKISNYYMKATSDPLLHERNMVCIIHEVIHTLGFTDGFYNSWLDYQTGKKISNPTTTVRVGNLNVKVVTAEPIRTMVRDYFGCPSLLGAYLENTGGSGTAASHFERRQFAYEAMTSGLIYQMQMSKFTLGMLESTGWFVPDYSYADPFFFGQGQGCGFVTGSCSTGQFQELCRGSGRGCTTVGRGGGVCNSDPATDNCRFQQPQAEYDCENSGAESFARLPGLQSFGRGSNSKCFMGTLATGRASSSTSFCFKYTCSGAGSGTQLTVHLNGQDVPCTSAGAKNVAGYAGTIDCPDPVAFCGTVGQKICPRGCMGRGTCVDGVCSCRPGYRGADCALNG